MNLHKAQKINLADYHDEKWLQARIEEDPALLGLGDLVVLRREHPQASGGRLDFLLHDQETDTMYEVEVMLGATDESHIIRTIEYWDIESWRNPSREHRAVIVAEKITSRFFNVIYLMNRAIPIIAVKLDALKLGDDLILHFTEVLNIREIREDTVALTPEATDRGYWEKWASAGSLASADAVTNLCKQLHPALKVTLKKGYIALGTERRNFCWLHPYKQQVHCRLAVYVGDQNADKAKAILEQAAIPFTPRKDEGELGLALSAKDVDEKRDHLKQVFQLAIQEKT
jgi:hypothetical protein